MLRSMSGFPPHVTVSGENWLSTTTRGFCDVGAFVNMEIPTAITEHQSMVSPQWHYIRSKRLGGSLTGEILMPLTTT